MNHQSKLWFIHSTDNSTGWSQTSKHVYMDTGGSLFTSGWIFPGRTDAGATSQTSYYLSCDFTYGLYTNAGLYLGGGIFPANISSRGAITGTSIDVSGSIVHGPNLHGKDNAFFYPGRVDVAAGNIQGSWYLGTHPAYGLYSNTGLYLAGAITVAGATNVNAISCTTVTCTGLNTQGGTINQAPNGQMLMGGAVWHVSGDNWQRLHFGWGGPTYIKGAGIVFRNTSNGADDTDMGSFTGAGVGGFRANGGIRSSWGFGCKPGVYGVEGGNWFNFQYTGNVQVWIDATYVGDIVFSDSRLKRDFTPLTGSLDKVLQMRPGSFYFRDGVDAAPRLRLGLQAQDLVEVAPELVRKVDLPTELTPDGTYQIDYTGMIPMLVAAMQELEQRVSRLE
jgi:hypothetical protein